MTMMHGRPMNVTTERRQDSFSIKNNVPAAFTRLRKNMLKFRVRVSLIVVVSDVSLEVISPVKDYTWPDFCHFSNFNG